VIDLPELLVREEVRHTIATYTAAGDQGDLAGLAACFAPDGVLAIVGREPLVGPEAIRTGLANLLARAPDDPRPAIAHAHHNLASLHFVSVAPDEVRTVAYFFVHTQIGLDHWGRYRDHLVPVDGTWRFARRDVKTDGYAPDSLFPRPEEIAGS
jgi:uncharacterized protein (TIGR02246 family)